MVAGQLFLFEDEELESEVLGHYFTKLVKRKELIHQHQKKQQNNRGRVIDDTIKATFLEPQTEDAKRQQETDYGIPEGLLDRLESDIACQGVGDAILFHHVLRAEDEHHLLVAFCRAKNDPGARGLRQRIRDILIRMNVRLVHNIVRSRFKNYFGQGAEKDDLIQYGIEGLARAIDGYDINKGCKLSTYATGWIQQAIQRGLDNESDMIRIPVHYHNYRGRMMAAKESLAAENGSLQFDICDIAEKTGLSKQAIEAVNTAASCACSLDASMGGEDSEGSDFGSFMTDDTADVEQDACRAVCCQKVRAAIRSLGAEKEYIILHRNGFIPGEKESQPYLIIAAKLGIPIKTVKELEKEAMSELQQLLKPLIK